MMIAERFIRTKGPGEAMEAAVSAGPVEDLPRSAANAPTFALGLPHDLGKRYAFPTATLKTLRVSNSSHSLNLPWGLSRGIRRDLS